MAQKVPLDGEESKKTTDSAAGGNRPEEQVGRTFGRLFGRIKRTVAWKRSERAYRDAVEGKDEEPGGQG